MTTDNEARLRKELEHNRVVLSADVLPFMKELDEFRARTWHRRAMKLMSENTDFVVVSELEEYYPVVYGLIRMSEKGKGTWTEEDERIFRHKMAFFYSEG